MNIPYALRTTATALKVQCERQPGEVGEDQVFEVLAAVVTELLQLMRDSFSRFRRTDDFVQLADVLN